MFSPIRDSAVTSPSTPSAPNRSVRKQGKRASICTVLNQIIGERNQQKRNADV